MDVADKAFNTKGLSACSGFLIPMILQAGIIGGLVFIILRLPEISLGI
ncbi:hypothetical protein FHT82_005807 [Rhizobium sp. BK275]|nr:MULTISPECIES: hypothetical protein [unclassified Rhizobium]MBB3393018.1 hypothetical protein [Rhizobium sp. BK275]MBB3409654.1 hypothetical protein [Rhizobium sp. BK316]